MEHGLGVSEIVGGVIALFLVASIILTICQRIKMPFTIILVLVGIFLSWMGSLYPMLLKPLHGMAITPELILYVFLPTLIFESAFNMDGRLLRHNIGPVLALAVPGLIISTAIIGIIIAFATPIPLVKALLLGAILSATDPVSVIALFKQLGAPHRLSILVEGESLLNDASSIVVARILMGMLVAGSITTAVVAKGIIDLTVIFGGGFLLGWILGIGMAWFIGKIELDAFVQITLTTVLAYLSYLIAEKVWHVSGVMATMGAGIALGGWGRVKISQSVRTYLENFWGYMAFVANALIFLLVGLKVNLPSLWKNPSMLLWVIIAMLVSRAVIVYGLIPIVTKRNEAESVDLRYQTIIFWGGLRGGIALALALSLSNFEGTESFVALVMGAVLFTLVVQGLTIEPLMKRMGLNRPPLTDRFALSHSTLLAMQNAFDRIPELEAGGLFSAKISENLKHEYKKNIADVRNAIQALRDKEMNASKEIDLLFLLSLSEEKSFFIDMLNKGHINERTFREHNVVLTSQIDAIRHGGNLEFVRLYSKRRRDIELRIFSVIEKLPGFERLSLKMRLLRTFFDYERSWARHQGSTHILGRLDKLAKYNAISIQAVEEVRCRYQIWKTSAQKRLDQMAEQYPEFVNTMQERLGRRMSLLSESQMLGDLENHGMLPPGIAQAMQQDISKKIGSLKVREVSKLIIEPTELLKKVPFFKDIPENEFKASASCMKQRLFSEGEFIIYQGEAGNSLFLIARGVVRVSREENGTKRDLATLFAGDFFGEMALLHNEPRSASIQAITSCTLYELSRYDLNRFVDFHPRIREALKEADQKRRSSIFLTENL